MKALVTGGSRGIGRAVALRFARQGWDVAITYRSNGEAAEETLRLGGDEDGVLIAKELDVRDSDAVDRVVDEVIGELDGLDVVVNNAGIMENQAAAMMSDEAWESVIATNLTGPFFVCRAVLTHFLMQRFGRIVNLSSVAQDGAAGQANYAASKAGLVGLTKSLAREYGPRGITANVVAPGLIETEMTAEVTAEVRERWMELCPAGRLGSADEVAEAVWSLSRREASFINGAVVHVSGGF
jgi:3-oxoacyl-[acyl-carrier protein] reductase